jgi:hypothetical protein
VHIVTVLSRSGEFAHRTAIDPAAGIDVPADRLDEEAPVGEQVDLLRRCLALPTDPPPCPSAVYWANRWLATILGAPPEKRADWDGVAELHPAVDVVRQARGASSMLLDPMQLVPVARGFARAYDWTRMRALLGAGRFEVEELVASDAEWFDDGAFARFLLNRCPPLAMLRDQVDALLPGPLAERVAATLTELDVPRTSWPDHAGRAA